MIKFRNEIKSKPKMRSAFIKFEVLVLLGCLLTLQNAEAQTSQTMKSGNYLSNTELSAVLMVRPGVEDFDSETVGQMLSCLQYYAPNVPNDVRVFNDSGMKVIQVTNPKNASYSVFLSINDGMALISELKGGDGTEITDPNEILLSVSTLLNQC